MAQRIDKELEEFRQVMEVPSSFEEGFNWTSLLGAIFVALLMVPGAIYMGLLAGVENIGSASQWVTVILFIEVAKRAQKTLKRAEIFVLFFMAAAALGMPFSGLIWNQFFACSDAAIAAGIAEHLPRWFAPPAGSESYALRTFMHKDWLPVIGMVIFGMFFGQLSNMVLGYGLFRLASDIERLPFPMAPIGAQGVMALAEDSDEKGAEEGEGRWRWRVFSIGGALGLVFGTLYLLLPTLTGALTGNPIQLFPIPFSDFTPQTGEYLPAVATGLSWDFGNIIFGMVLPFFAMVGSFVGLIATVVLNPLLHAVGVLRNWVPGDSTIGTLYKNNIDFFFSFNIGLALAIALAGFYQVIRSFQGRRKTAGGEPVRLAPAGRGDIRPFIVVVVYFLVTITYILVSGWMVDWHRGIMIVLLFLGFVYTPVISYVTARLEGMVGQVVEVPYIREAALILSGYRGVAVWFLPIPMANYGQMAIFYKQCELTGTRFPSIWKTQVILFPIILLSSIFFMNFIWSLNEVPSAVYPYAEMMWKLNAENACIMFSSTLGEYSIFEEAFNVLYIAIGAVFGVALFGAMNTLGAPIMLTYGVVRGLGGVMPHWVIPQFIGALIGRYYFQKRLGLRWRQYIPVVSAGFACGMGLITTVGVGITFLSKASIPLPF
ncbi:MAG TPA: peptide transporter [Kiritimatiellia bacterium]|nr:peptide transporter [Kiritimatiellia bacterium]HRZ12470.1 peptide transporter [Kiritimatiellia bacterium]HSA17772.1 peptide transporter [Kiritimatiellia bacterium]